MQVHCRRRRHPFAGVAQQRVLTDVLGGVEVQLGLGRVGDPLALQLHERLVQLLFAPVVGRLSSGLVRVRQQLL